MKGKVTKVDVVATERGTAYVATLLLEDGSAGQLWLRQPVAVGQLGEVVADIRVRQGRIVAYARLEVSK